MQKFLASIKVKYFFLFFICLICSTYGTLINVQSYIKDVYINDKVLHFAIFFILSFCASNAFFWQKKYTIIVLLFYGALIELIQDLLPYRASDLSDFLANTLGVLFYFLLASWKDFLKK